MENGEERDIKETDEIITFMIEEDSIHFISMELLMIQVPY